MANQERNLLGISGLGRIGKLTLWNQLTLDHYDGFVINMGRSVGTSLADLIEFVSNDSTYGSLERFLYGYSKSNFKIEIINEENGEFEIDGRTIKVLMKARNPKDINWKAEGVKVVVDCTGVFLDPTVEADAPKGSVRGHLEAGAERVVVSAPFKLSNKENGMPEDAAMMVYGINHEVYDNSKHKIVSAASCTTTALSHMMKPLLDTEETSKIVTASMSTIHAATNNQSILDKPAQAGTSDLRRNRSAFNNIILTSTGAAKALEVVLPQIKGIGFMADSVRIPTTTVSLVCLNVTFRTTLDSDGNPVIDNDFINGIYKNASEGAHKDLLVYTDNQNVSSDLKGLKASCIIEGAETRTKTGFLPLPKGLLYDYGVAGDIQLPVTHAKIFGWYDNEFGNYVNSLSNIVLHIDKELNK